MTPYTFAKSAITAAVAVLAFSTANAHLMVTEVTSQGSPKDWFELTNVGAETIDLTGYRMSDDQGLSRAPDVVALQGITAIAAGESVLFIGDGVTAAQLASFKASHDGVPVGTFGNFGLGSEDEVNVYGPVGDTPVAGIGWSSHPPSGECWTYADNDTNALRPMAAACSPGEWLPPLVITEVTSQGQPKDWFELTNTGSAPIDVTGYRMSDDAGLSRAPGVVALQGITEIAAGESVLFIGDSVTAAQLADFKASHDGVQVGTFGNFGLGGADQVNLYSASGTAPLSSISWSRHPNPAATMCWTNPLNAAHVTDPVEALCSPGQHVSQPPEEGISLTGLDEPLWLAGVVGEATEHYASTGLAFAIEAADQHPGLQVQATVFPEDVAQVVVELDDGHGRLRILPGRVGYATITVEVTDDLGARATRTIQYGASANDTANEATRTRWLAGRSDLSAAIRIGGLLLTADDEPSNLLLAYDFDYADAQTSGSRPPLWTWPVPDAELGVAVGAETDLEAGALWEGTVYWTGSHGNNRNGNLRPERQRIFATAVSGEGASMTLALAGHYAHLRTDMLAWDSGNGHGLGADALQLTASAQQGIAPESADLDGFSIEGLSFAADGSGWLGFRAPLVAPPGAAPAIQPGSATGRTHALIVPVANFHALANGAGAAADSAEFGSPIFLDLGGRGIREIQRNAAGEYLIIAGPPDGATGTAPKDFRLYIWDGSVDDDHQAVNLARVDADLTGMLNGMQASPEGVADLPATLHDPLALVTVISDSGDVTDFYGDDQLSEAKELPEGHRKSRVDQLALGHIDAGRFRLAIGTVSGGSVACDDAIVAFGGSTACTAQADEGYVFVQWTVGQDACVIDDAQAASTSIRLQGACELGATFAPEGAPPEPVTQRDQLPLPAGGQGEGLTADFSITSSDGNRCSIERVEFIAPSASIAAQAALPYGLVDFQLTGCTPGATAEITITYPAALDGLEYLKPIGSSLRTVPATITGNRVTFTIEDNGADGLDQDARPGVIADPSGPGVRRASHAGDAVPVPLLPAWLLALMAAALAMVGGRRLAAGRATR